MKREICTPIAHMMVVASQDIAGARAGLSEVTLGLGKYLVTGSGYYKISARCHNIKTKSKIGLKHLPCRRDLPDASRSPLAAESGANPGEDGCAGVGKYLADLSVGLDLVRDGLGEGRDRLGGECASSSSKSRPKSATISRKGHRKNNSKKFNIKMVAKFT
jgi:hypothetical protein